MVWHRLAVKNLLNVMNNARSVAELRGHAREDEALPRRRKGLLNVWQ